MIIRKQVIDNNKGRYRPLSFAPQVEFQLRLVFEFTSQFLAFWWRGNCTENVVENMRADILEKKCYLYTAHKLKLSKTKRSFWYQNLSVLSAKILSSSQIN